MEKVQIGECTLYRGDCREVLPELYDPDAVVTDPPYGINLKSHGGMFVGMTPIAGDESLDIANYVRSWAGWRKCACLMFFSPYKPMTGWRNVLCWSKGDHVGRGGDPKKCWHRNFELIGVEGNGPLNGKRQSAVLRFNAISPNFVGMVHPAEKPLPLMVYLVEKITNAGGSVLDPFMGSGTTGVACVKTGRKFVGIELDPAHFATACRRIEAAYADQPLLAGVA
jgi:site-specific DNA-methyltransferase (adenine-specific)